MATTPTTSLAPVSRADEIIVNSSGDTGRISVASLAAQIASSLALNGNIPGVLGVDINTPPPSPTDGYSVVVGTAPTGAFATRANQVATYSTDNAAWTFVAPVTPPTGVSYVLNFSDGKTYFFNGTAWVETSDPAQGFSQTIGIPTAPTSAGVSNLNQWFVIADAVAGDGAIKTIRAWMMTAGTIYVARFKKTGNVFTQVDNYTPVNLGVNGLNTKQVNIPVKAGEFLGWWQGDVLNGIVAQGTTTTYGTGLYTYPSRSPLSEWVDATLAQNRFQIGFDIAYDGIEAVTSRLDRNAALDGLVGYGSQFVGRLELPTAGQGGLANRCFIFPSPAADDGVVQGFQCYSLAAGVIYAKVFSKDVSGNYTQVGADVAIAVKGGAVTTLTKSSLPYIKVLKGQYLGFFNPVNSGMVTFINTGTLGTGSPYIQKLSTGGDFSYLAAADVEIRTTASIQLGFTLALGRERDLDQRITVLENSKDATLNDEIIEADIRFSGLGWAAYVTLSRRGELFAINGSGTLTATTSTNIRYDTLYLDAVTLTLGVVAGTQRASDPAYFIPAIGATTRLPVANLRVQSGAVTQVPTWNFRDGRPIKSLAKIEHNVTKFRSRLPKLMGMIARGEAIKYAAFGDSISAQRFDGTANINTAPNGSNRDRAVDGVYLANFGSDVKALIPTYTAAALGRTPDANGSVYTRIGPHWAFIAEMEARGYTLGFDIFYDNWGIAGASTNTAVSSGTPTAWLNNCVAGNYDVIAVWLGMNEYASTTFEANLGVIIDTIRASGAEPIIMDCARRPPGVSGPDPDGWRINGSASYRICEAKQAAHFSLVPLEDDRYLGAMGVAVTDLCESDNTSHPGLTELAAFGREYVKHF